MCPCVQGLVGEKLLIKVSPRAKQACIEGPRDLVAHAKATIEGRLQMLVSTMQARPTPFARMLDTPSVRELVTHTLSSQGLHLHWKVEKGASEKGATEKGAPDKGAAEKGATEKGATEKQDGQLEDSGASDALIQIRFFSFAQTDLAKSLCMSSFTFILPFLIPSNSYIFIVVNRMR